MLSTSDPQCWQWWGSQRGRPRRSPTAIWRTLSSMHRPREDTGKASNQAPDSFVATARRRARVLSLGAASKRASNVAWIRGASQAFWRQAEVPHGGRSSRSCFQIPRACSTVGSGTSHSCRGRIWRTRSEQPAAEAKKAEGASWAALRMPIPPAPMGREAWSQALSSLRCTLVMSPNMDLRRSS